MSEPSFPSGDMLPLMRTNRMLKKSASFVLASLRGSEALEGIFRSPRSILRANGHTKCGWYRLASSLVAALLDGQFEHPETILLPVHMHDSIYVL